MPSNKAPVLVTGATGFIALWVVDILLTKGYPVIGTVRSAAKGNKIAANFAKERPGTQFSYAVVTDFIKENAFDAVLTQHKDIEYVIHSASPVTPIEGDIEDVYIKPAINGTVNILKSIKKLAPQVKKVVLTSSLFAMVNLNVPDNSYLLTEESWNPITREEVVRENAYAYSKTHAEKLAWDFLKEEKPNFTLTVVTPPYVFGLQRFTDTLAGDRLNYSTEFLASLLRTTPEDDEADYSLVGDCVNVKDIALFHVLPLENDAMAGERLLPIVSRYSRQGFLNFLNDRFPELKGKIAKGHPERAAEIEAKGLNLDVSKTLKLGGVELIPFEQTITETVQQILDYKKTH